jgi:hypothetical protein
MPASPIHARSRSLALTSRHPHPSRQEGSAHHCLHPFAASASWPSCCKGPAAWIFPAMRLNSCPSSAFATSVVDNPISTPVTPQGHQPTMNWTITLRSPSHFGRRKRQVFVATIVRSSILQLVRHRILVSPLFWSILAGFFNADARPTACPFVYRGSLRLNSLESPSMPCFSRHQAPPHRLWRLASLF